jgi:hypothetical protein
MKSKGYLRGHSPIPIRHAKVRARFLPTLQVLEQSCLGSRGMYALPAANEICCDTWCEYAPRASVNFPSPLHSKVEIIHR